MTAAEQGIPEFSEEDARKLVLDLYGLSATAGELPSYIDQNFHLQRESGQDLVLKIANSGEGEDTIELQHQALAHIAARDPSLLCPRVYPTPSGEQITEVETGDGSRHYVRIVTYLPGVFLAEVDPHTPELLHSLGRFLGALGKALEGFSHPAAHRSLAWDLQNTSLIGPFVEEIAEPERRRLVEHFLSKFETFVEPVLPSLRRSVIHNDGNDHNVLVADAGSGNRRVVGIIDFGDMVYSKTVCELAVSAAYVMLGKADPIAAAVQVVAGCHEVLPLTVEEVEILFYLLCARLCISVSMSAHQRTLQPDNEYLAVTEEPAWVLLEKLTEIDPRLAHYSFRHACNMAPCPNSDAVVRWLKDHQQAIGPVVESDLRITPKVVFDLGTGSRDLEDVPDISDTQAFTEALFGRMEAAKAEVGIGKYDEDRGIYRSDIFRPAIDGTQDWRTVHLGIDLFMPASSPVFSPLDGVVHSFCNNTAALDYGPTIILQHEMDEGRVNFFTLYGHLSEDSLEGLYEGMPITKGVQIAKVGNYPTNGGWPPHLHFQIITDMLGQMGNFNGVSTRSERALWLSICPDPNLILGMPEECFSATGMSREEILEIRRRHFGKSLSAAYKNPLKIVRGSMQYLFDDTGRAYLDLVNNVCHVGHCHPRVVAAAQQQIALLNTNTRYLHDNLAQYVERLCSTLPEPLSVCFLVCTGSEANELALRLARTHTLQTDIVTVDGAYHGNTTSLIEISPYKFDGRGGSGAPAHVRKVRMPDHYRGVHKADDPRAGEKYAQDVGVAVEDIKRQGRGVAAFFCESAPGCGGQIILPDGYLREAYGHVRKAGAVCVADEVHVGFGRMGSHFWGFETQGVVPDIVTLGKPIGNGHPMAAVVTTPEIAASFANGMEYFNTFGGNPVSCAVGLAVLDVLAEEGLQENALRVGARLKANLEQLKARHPLIGDVRGLGLFIGVELVSDRETLAPAAAEAETVIERMKEEGILVSIDGPLYNVLKIKPPLVVSEANADWVADALDRVLAEHESS
ncbi:MAG: aminotransferase class III-fold pyridoxal phosphate-dependent enzyme [bacterium]|nr:aminotransferase class III-fold pyridoxal phosphate-dependent enzyme [bacterium]